MSVPKYGMLNRPAHATDTKIGWIQPGMLVKLMDHPDGGYYGTEYAGLDGSFKIYTAHKKNVDFIDEIVETPLLKLVML